MNEEMEMAGSYVAKSGVRTTIKARVFEPDGKGGRRLLADLGTIVGERSQEEGRRTNRLLQMLKERREVNAAKGVDNG